MPEIQQPSMPETQKYDPIWQEVFAIAQKEGRSLEFFEVTPEGHKVIMGPTCTGMTMAKTED